VQADSLIRADAGKKSFHLVDIRTPEEFATGHIKGAKLMDFYASDFRSRLSTLPRDAKVVLYCRSGNRSGQALSAMKELGFKDASHIAGGINAWRSQSLAIEP
jgi:rhodanese-related sulfurtransferase